MYTISDFFEAVKYPEYAAREINKKYNSLKNGGDGYSDGVVFFERDWDNLIILDAFRYDVFRTLHSFYEIPGELEVVHSRSSATDEFLEQNIDGRDLTDSVYVSGSSMFERKSQIDDSISAEWHDTIYPWSDDDEAAFNPRNMSQAGLDALSEYPNKKLVLHYIQPHIPFIGEYGERMFSDFEGVSPWEDKFTGDLNQSDDDLLRAYIENCQIILEEMEWILPRLDGKTVVTADHGQAMGERSYPIPVSEWGHPSETYMKELVQVPWLVVDSGSRRETESGEPIITDNTATETVRNNLKDLGYLDG